MNRHSALPLVACFSLLLSACGGETTPTAESAAVQAKPALTVEIVAPRMESWPETVAASGAVAAWQEASIGAELSGVRIEDVLVNVGDRVKRGQLLARFSEDALQAEHAQLSAQIAEAEAALAKAKLDAEVADRMEASGGLSKQEIRSIRTQAVIAEARTASARATREALAVRLRQARIVAPDDGVISARSATIGVVASPGLELFRLIRGGRLEWRAEIRAEAMSRLRPGMVARFRAPQGESITGRLRQVAPTVNPQTLTGIAYVDIPAGTALAGGVFASGEIEMDAREVMVLPVSALVFRTGAQHVMTVDKDRRIREVKVTTGSRRKDEVEIVSGLDAKAQVALAGGAFLNEGDLVAVAEKP